jgi:hypothetical protein
MPVLFGFLALLVFIGSVGPWASVFIIDVSGTEGDGVITLMLALAAGSLAVVLASRPMIRWTPWAIGGCLLASAMIGVYDWLNIRSVAGDPETFVNVTVGWGLVIMTLASMAGVVLSGLAILQRSGVNRQPARVGAGAAGREPEEPLAGEGE